MFLSFGFNTCGLFSNGSVPRRKTFATLYSQESFEFRLTGEASQQEERKLQKSARVGKHPWEKALGMQFGSEETRGPRKEDNLRHEWEEETRLDRRNRVKQEKMAEEERRRKEKEGFKRVCREA